MHKLTLLLLVAISLLTACGETPPAPTATPAQSSSTTAVLPTDTAVPTAAPTDTPAHTETSTSTPEPTASVTPTLIPTPDLPVGPGNSLPQPLLQIAPDNVSGLSELVRYGTARIYATFLSADRSTILALTGEGIKAYQADGMGRLAWFTDPEPFTSDAYGLQRVLSISADGSRFALFTANRQAHVYDLQDGLVYSQTLDVGDFWVALSPDGLNLARPQDLSEDWTPRWQLVDIATGELIADGIGMNTRFSPKGKYLVGDASDTLFIYRTSDWQEQTQIGLRAGGETALDWSFSPDERYLAVVMSGGVTVWEVETRQRVRQFNPVTGTEAQIRQAFFSEDSSQMAVVEYIERVSSNLLVWNITDGSLVSNQTTKEAGTYDYDVILLDADGFHGFSVPRESDGSGYQSPQWRDWHLALDLTQASLNVVDITGWDSETLQPAYKACTFAFLSPSAPDCMNVSGLHGVTTDGMGNFYTLWQATGDNFSLYSGFEQSGNALLTFSTDGFQIRPMGVSPDHSLLVYTLGDGDSTLQVREINTRRLLYTEDTTGRVERVRFIADGSRLVATINNPQTSHPQLLVYDVVQNAVLYRLPAQDQMEGSSAVLSMDGQRLAYRFERTDALRWSGIQVWDPLHQRQLAEWEGRVETLGNPMAFSPDGRLLATADDLGTAFLLDAETGTVLHHWKAHADTILNLTFSPDGLLLSTIGTDGFLRIWGIYP